VGVSLLACTSAIYFRRLQRVPAANRPHALRGTPGGRILQR
jgi:hypothetical protein